MEDRRIWWSKFKRKFLKHIWIARAVVIAGILTALVLVGLVVKLVFAKTPIGRSISVINAFIFTPETAVTSINGRTNLLILGKAGEGQTAPDLTDTIIFTSLAHQDRSVALISVPRDIWIPELRAKLNSAYYWGNQKEEKAGLVLAKSSVEEIVGQPISYGIVIDFSSFVKAIDTIGGIKVDVEKGFTDEKYPVVGREADECDGDIDFKCRYETLEFRQGVNFMDGELALKFVRSRNAEGEEGTDLARAARQQKVLVAVRDKVLSPEVFLSPGKIFGLAKIAKNSIETDLGPQAAAILARRILQSRENVSTHVLPEELLINPPISKTYDSQYVFIPKDESWEEIHSWVEGSLP